MNFRRVMSCFAIAFLAIGPAIAQGPPPAAAFARLPDLEHVRMSPDGTKLAWIGDHEGRRVLSIYDLAAKHNTRHIAQGIEYRLRSVEWADDHTVLLTVEGSSVLRTGTIVREAVHYSRVVAFDPIAGEGHVLLLGASYRTNVTGSELVRISTARPNTVFMSALDFTASRYDVITLEPILREGRKDSQIKHSLFEVTTSTGEGRKIESGTPFTTSWFVNRHGKPVARSEWNRGTAEFRVLAKLSDGGWISIYESDSQTDLQPVALSTDESELVAIGAHGGERKRAWLIPLDGREIRPFSETEEEIESIVTDPFTGAPIGFRLGGLAQKMQWLDPKLGQIQLAIERSFPKRRVDIVDFTRDYSRVLVRAEEGDFPPIYYLIHLGNHSADMVGEAYPELADAPIGHRQSLQYKTRDGLSIPAFLTLPPDIDAKALPLIVLAESEPFEKLNFGFDWRAQFLATRGYAVLQPQFREPEGLKPSISAAGARVRGRAMHDDIADGVRYLVQEHIADPSRVCIVGFGYGGYAAVMGPTLEPSLYSCGVGVNAVTNLRELFGYLNHLFALEKESNTVQGWKDLVGDPDVPGPVADLPEADMSAIKVPMLMIHSIGDSVVPYRQTDNFARLMAKHQLPHTVITLESEDHWLSTNEGRLRTLHAIEEFLSKHLGHSGP